MPISKSWLPYSELYCYTIVAEEILSLNIYGLLFIALPHLSPYFTALFLIILVEKILPSFYFDASYFNDNSLVHAESILHFLFLIVIQIKIWYVLTLFARKLSHLKSSFIYRE